MVKLLPVVVLALVACVAMTDALKCYKCTDCKEAKDSGDCAADDKYCFIRGYETNETWIRGCAKTTDAACPEADKDKKYTDCSTCQEDDCNSANIMSISFGMSLFLASLVALMR